MNMHDRQDEVGAILAQIAMIAEEVNVIALSGSGAGCTHVGQVAIVAEVQLRIKAMMKLFGRCCQSNGNLSAVDAETPKRT
jgi:hypothetical protein